jgi:hypothetical protein
MDIHMVKPHQKIIDMLHKVKLTMDAEGYEHSGLSLGLTIMIEVDPQYSLDVIHALQETMAINKIDTRHLTKPKVIEWIDLTVARLEKL